MAKSNHLTKWTVSQESSQDLNPGGLVPVRDSDHRATLGSERSQEVERGCRYQASEKNLVCPSRPGVEARLRVKVIMKLRPGSLSVSFLRRKQTKQHTGQPFLGTSRRGVSCDSHPGGHE